ncbi:MAG: tautomerase family protein [Granulosicoccus sp.]
MKPDDNFCLISRYSQQDMIVHPTFLGSRDPDSSIVVEITLLGGRTDEQKEGLYRDFRNRLKTIGFEPNNSIIFLIENNAIDWSFSEAGPVKSVLGLD